MGKTWFAFALTVLVLTLNVSCIRRTKEQACRVARCGKGEKCQATFSCRPQPCDGGYYSRCVPDYKYAGLCALPVSRGMCMAAFRSFYYDTTEEECLPFYYGGCMGNGNRFRTEEQCRALCILGGAGDFAESEEAMETD